MTINDEEESIVADDPPVTEADMMRAVYSFNALKAPENNGVMADICLQAISARIDIFLEIINKCLQLSLFPAKWKCAYIKLRKPYKPD